MSPAATAAPKTYLAEHASLSITVKLEDGTLDTVAFSGGKFTTSNPVEQAAIEACELYRSGHVKPEIPADPREALEASVGSAKAAADAADKTAAKAEKALADFLNGPQALRALADKADKALEDAEDALADFDKKAAAPKEDAKV